MFRWMSVVGAAFAVVVAAQSAGAAPDASVTVLRTQVHFGDLNLATPQGRSILQARVDAAAARSCGGNPAFSTHFAEARTYVRNDFELCRAEALGRAEAELHALGVESLARR